MGMPEERITKAQKNVARMGARKADPQLNKQERHGGWLTGTRGSREPRGNGNERLKQDIELFLDTMRHSKVGNTSIPSHSSTSYH